MFTNEEYAKALDKFIVGLRDIRNFYDLSHTAPVFREMCGLLRIGKIETRYFQTPAHEMINNGIISLLYDGGCADDDPERGVIKRDVMENGGVGHCVFFPIAGEEDWNEEEREKINVMNTLLVVYTGRNYLITVANDLEFNDFELKIPNLTFMLRTFGELIARGIESEYGAVYFNLKHFSVVNNQVGRDEGTVIMKKYVHSLRNKLEEMEFVCRIGGDNFAALFRKEHLNIVTEHLSGVKIKSEKFHAEFLIRACGGFYLVNPGECKRPADIMEKIALTSNIAKKNPNTPFVFYDAEIQENVRRAKQIEDMIPNALRHREFLVYYQPKVSMKAYTLSGAEALCRWKHEGELIPPFRFIPVLERSKLICELDFYMLDRVCEDIRRWLDEGKSIVKVSVNLSRVHLGDANLLEDIIGIIDRHSVPHKYIEIELTETTTDVDYSELKKLVAGLREAGISTSVDDFGIGYSSLNLIRELPWNVLKIDKSFLPEETDKDDNKRVMLGHIISMAQEIGLECIVEGVENMEQVMLLKEFGCYLAQGFYFDRPLPVEVFEERLSG